MSRLPATGARSSSVIVSVAVELVPRRVPPGPVGLLNVKFTNVAAFVTVLSRMGTVKVWFVTPGRNVSAPLTPLKSKPSIAFVVVVA